LKFERGSTRSHGQDYSLWKTLWTSRKTAYTMNGMQLGSQTVYDTTHIVRRTLSDVSFTQYDMLPKHENNIRN